ALVDDNDLFIDMLESLIIEVGRACDDNIVGTDIAGLAIQDLLGLVVAVDNGEFLLNYTTPFALRSTNGPNGKTKPLPRNRGRGWLRWR
ncbi:MAG: hypothetical protein IKU27_02545, partial [Clostridia bacterium]|nr:hypothetical protein [Clostridia bacterium]